MAAAGPNADQLPHWKGEYYANQQLSGDPNFVRNDSANNFNWGTGGPGVACPANISPPAVGAARSTSPRTFTSSMRDPDDGIRAWVDGNLIIDQWHDSPGNIVYTSQLWLSGAHWLVVEYYQNYGTPWLTTWWFAVPPPPPPR